MATVSYKQIPTRPLSWGFAGASIRKSTGQIMSSAIEREEAFLEDQLANGEITLSEFNREMREVQRDFRAAAEEAAQEAYDNEMGHF